MVTNIEDSTKSKDIVNLGSIRQDTPPGSVIQYSDYEIDWSSPYAGGAAWIEGQFVPAADARVSLFDAGFLYSDSTYTGATVWHGNMYRLDDHLDRLLEGAERMRLGNEVSRDDMADIARECVARSQLREALVNWTITRGYPVRGASSAVPRVYISAIPYMWIFTPQEQFDGISAIVPRHVRRAGRNTVDPTIKNRQWGDLNSARYEATDQGARTAILLDADNCVTEGPGFNVVMVKNGQLISPGRNVLPGITRKAVYEIATELEIPATLSDIPSQDLYTADELMAVSTAGAVTPITSVDGRTIGQGSPGSFTSKIRDALWESMCEPSSVNVPIEY